MAMVSAFHMQGKVLADRYQVSHTVEGERLVCRGTDRRGGTPVTIYLYADPSREDPAAFARLQALVDPSIVRILATGVEHHTSYVVTESLDGYFLSTELRGGPLTAQRILAIAARACDAVTVLHANEIAHGEVSPQKVYVGWPRAADDVDTSDVKLAPPSTVRAATPQAIATDVDACRKLIEAMLEPDAIAPLRELAKAPASTAAALAERCREVLAALRIDERNAVGKRPKPPAQTERPPNMPMPTNWSPPPPPRQFAYSSSTPPSQPLPEAIVRPPEQRGAIVLALVIAAAVGLALLLWLLR